MGKQAKQALKKRSLGSEALDREPIIGPGKNLEALSSGNEEIDVLLKKPRTFAAEKMDMKVKLTYKEEISLDSLASLLHLAPEESCLTAIMAFVEQCYATSSK